MIIFSLILIPMLIALGFLIFCGKKVTLKEFLIQTVVQLLIAFITVSILYWSNTSDTEVWNGHVHSKNSERVSCEHSYSCHCYESCSGSGSSSSCTTICQTCYEHWYDVDWAVYTTNGERLTINRVDRQGINKPQRWDFIEMGEFTSVAHGYTNYIKASPDTLFRHQGLIEKYKAQIPTYPNNI